MKRYEFTPLLELQHTPLDKVLPARSRLISLEPIGLGTARSEGLGSYLIRLAWAHSVNPRRLIRTEFVAAQPEIAKLIRAEFLRRNARTINGLGFYASAFCQATTTLTGAKNLRYLTLLPLRHLLSRNSEGLLARYVQWCPACFAEMAKSGEEAYRPLAWSFRHYRYCRIHQQPLVEYCPECGSRQAVIPAYPSVGHCSRCGAWLGRDMNHGDSPSQDHLWISAAVEDVIGNLHEMETSATSRHFAQAVADAIHRSKTGSRTAFSRQIGIKHGILDDCLSGRQPGFVQWLALAYGMNTMPSRLFLPRDPGTEYEQGELRISPAALRLRGPQPLRSAAERQRLASDLSEIAAAPGDCDSLSEIARRFHRDPSALKRWAPEACHRIQAKYRDAVALKAEQRRARDFEKLKAVVRELIENGEYPGGGKVNKRLREQGVALVRPELKKAYHEALAEWIDGARVPAQAPEKQTSPCQEGADETTRRCRFS